MRPEFSLRRFSLKTRLILNYGVVLAIGGLSTSLVGSWIVSSSIMTQARRSVDRLVATARELYEQQLSDVRRTVALGAAGLEERALDRGASAFLEPIRAANGLDFLTLVDSQGRVLLRTTGRTGFPALESPLLAAARNGRTVAGSQSVSPAALAAENSALAARGGPESSMVLIAAAPVRVRGAVAGVLYGGVLLNANPAIVNRTWQLVFKDDQFEGRDVGEVSIFHGSACIATTLQRQGGQAQLPAAPAEALREVLSRGRTWRGRSQLRGEWYISGYDPIQDSSGRTAGMLSVGLLERAYTATRDRVILSFFAIASIGFVLIIAITYYEVRTITHPLGVMAAATRSIAAGRFDHEVDTRAQGEIAQLADSFNLMLHSLRQMRGDLEEWGRTLEEKVRQRTEQLAAMQSRVAQSERLASVGMLAAGVAHEINNPLGGILSLTALTLEDLSQDDPNRENLEIVLKQAQRCRDIVRKLLEFSRQSEPKAEMLDLNQVLEDTHSLIARQAAFHNIEVVKQWDPALPAVLGDKSQLTQVFMNMMINAVQAMEERGRLTISTRTAADGAVEVEIRDTGCGIPKERISQVFDPFFTTKESGQGTGLGMSIAYGIVTAHRGAIGIESEVGQGTAFTIRLPAASVPVE